jgi:hypothetical protein
MRWVRSTPPWFFVVAGFAAACGDDATSEDAGVADAATWDAPGPSPCSVAPAPPSNPAPADDAADVDWTLTRVGWDEAADADEGYDVYLGACPLPDYPDPRFTRVSTPGLTGFLLSSGTEYCWQVVSVAGAGEGCATPGPAWSFQTAAIGCEPEGSDCDDENRCTTNDTCLDAICLGQLVDCTDLILCTAEECDLATGDCEVTDVDPIGRRGSGFTLPDVNQHSSSYGLTVDPITDAAGKVRVLAFHSCG